MTNASYSTHHDNHHERPDQQQHHVDDDRDDDEPRVLPPPSSEATPHRNSRACMGINPCLLILLALYVSFLLFLSFSTKTTTITIIHLLLSLIPPAIIAHYTFRYLVVQRSPNVRDVERGHGREEEEEEEEEEETLSKGYLINTFLLSFMPLTFVIVIIELVSAILLLFVIIGKANIKKVSELLSPLSSSGQQLTPEELIQEILKLIPAWRLFLLAIATAFITAAITEEMGKWLLCKYRINKLSVDNTSDKDMLAIAIFASLGLATVENTGFSLSLAASAPASPELSKLFLMFLRDIMAFPIHVGGTLAIAITLAETGSIWKGLLLAVCVHGSFDALPMVTSMFKLGGFVDDWIDWVVLAIQLLIVLVFTVLVWSRVRRLVQRDTIIDPVS